MQEKLNVQIKKYLLFIYNIYIELVTSITFKSYKCYIYVYFNYRQ